jgi:hypothetical protein
MEATTFGRVVVLVVAVVAVGVSPTPSQALPHGCVSVSSSYSLGFDFDRRSLTPRVHTNEPCSFYFSPGDTYSGIGVFIVKCSSGGEINHFNYLGVDQPIPQPCEPGAIVTIHANQPFQGGSVVAGTSPNRLMPDVFVPQPNPMGAENSWRYVVPPVQGPEDFPLPPPIPSLAPFGMVTIVPEGTTVTVTIADDLAPDGSFLFKICQMNTPDPGDSYCGSGVDDVSTGDICYTGPETLGDVVPGSPVEVTLWFSTSPCPDSPTTGTLTVVG